VHEAVHNQSGNSYAVKVLRKVGRDGGIAHIDAIKQEVVTWAQAQGSKFVAKLEGLYEVRGLGAGCSHTLQCLESMAEGQHLAMSQVAKWLFFCVG
jgi:hypothetical protein